MAGYFDLRLDFVHFLHGVPLVMLAQAAFGLDRLERHRNWRYFGYFAALQAAVVWLGMLPAPLRLAPAATQGTLFIASCIALFVFARRRIPIVRNPIVLGATLILPGLAAAALATQGARGVLCWAQLLYGAASAMLAGYTLVLRARLLLDRPAAGRLRLVAAGLFVYMGARGSTIALCPPGSVHILSAEHAATIHLLCAAVALLLTGVVTRHYCVRHHHELHRATGRPSMRFLIPRTLLVLAILGSAWSAAEVSGGREDARLRRDVLARTRMVAIAIEADKIEQLRWDASDAGTHTYQHAKAVLRTLVHANPDVRFAMITGFRDEKAYFLADSEPPNSPDYSPPGQLYGEASPAYLEAVKMHKPFVIGPLMDRWGTWMSASVPLGPGSHPGSWITADLDVSAVTWNERIQLARLPGVLIASIVTLLLFTIAHARDRLHETLSQLTRSEHRNRSLVEGSPNCVQLFDSQGHCQAINENGIRALGLHRQDVLGRPFSEIWPPGQRASVQHAVDRTLRGEPMNFEAEYVRPDGGQVIWRVNTTPVRDYQRRVQSFVVIAVDITSLKNSEKDLTAAKEAAEAATQAKSEFLAVMSHEIRTPLGGVIGMLNALRKQQQDDEHRLYTDLACENAETLLQLLDDILDAAKVEAGKLSLEAIPFDPRLEFTRVIEPMRLRAEAKGLTLVTSVAPSVPDVLVGDPTRLRQVLANFLSNALKFTEQGSISVLVECVPGAAPAMAILCLRVVDTGIGIPEDQQPRLFQSFQQADISTTRKFGGTGLGLSIVKTLAELMQGEVSLVSRPGSGTTFTFTAQLQVSDRSRLPPDTLPGDTAELPRHRARLHVLCAEDDPTNQIAAEFVVKQMGHTIEFVENGRQAVDWLSQARADVILMDNRMPEMDGFQATRLIRDRSSSVLDHDVYIIANTANAGSNYRQRCLDCGMNDYLIKPLREAQLHVALERAIDDCLRRGLTLQKMPDCPPARGRAPAPAKSAGGMTEAELLAVLEEASATPTPRDAAAGLSSDARTRIAAQFVHDAPERLREIRAALNGGDQAVGVRAAHSLKSTSHYVQAASLSELGAEMERLMEAGQFDDVSGLLELADHEFQEIRLRLGPALPRVSTKHPLSAPPTS